MVINKLADKVIALLTHNNSFKPTILENTSIFFNGVYDFESKHPLLAMDVNYNFFNTEFYSLYEERDIIKKYTIHIMIEFVNNEYKISIKTYEKGLNAEYNYKLYIQNPFDFLQQTNDLIVDIKSFETNSFSFDVNNSFDNSSHFLTSNELMNKDDYAIIFNEKFILLGKCISSKIVPAIPKGTISENKFKITHIVESFKKNIMVAFVINDNKREKIQKFLGQDLNDFSINYSGIKTINTVIIK